MSAFQGVTIPADATPGSIGLIECGSMRLPRYTRCEGIDSCVLGSNYLESPDNVARTIYRTASVRVEIER